MPAARPRCHSRPRLHGVGKAYLHQEKRPLGEGRFGGCNRRGGWYALLIGEIRAIPYPSIEGFAAAVRRRPRLLEDVRLRPGMGSPPRLRQGKRPLGEGRFGGGATGGGMVCPTDRKDPRGCRSLDRGIRAPARHGGSTSARGLDLGTGARRRRGDSTSTRGLDVEAGARRRSGGSAAGPAQKP